MAYANPADKLARGRSYYAENKDRIAAARRAQYASRKHDDVAGILLRTARSRAARKGIPCTITLADITVPAVCPVLGLPLKKSDGQPSDNSPSLDQIIPGVGYIPGNVRVISHRANRLKADASASELELIIADIRSIERKVHGIG